MIQKSTELTSSENKIISKSFEQLHCKLCESLIGYKTSKVRFIYIKRLLLFFKYTFYYKIYYRLSSVELNETPKNIMRILFVSFKLDRCSLIHNSIEDYIPINKNQNIDIVYLKIHKDSKDDIKQIKDIMEKERIDNLVIIHKIELRTLLLGVNGYYNLLINTFYKQLSK